MAEEQQNQDVYHIDLMRTLWENTYRGTVFNYKDQYVATVRLIFSIPLDRSEVPENAPEVNPVIIVLVEDTALSPLEIVDFEQAMTPILAKRLTSEYFQPDRILKFDGLSGRGLWWRLMDTPQRGLSIKPPAHTKNAPKGVFFHIIQRK